MVHSPGATVLIDVARALVVRVLSDLVILAHLLSVVRLLTTLEGIKSV